MASFRQKPRILIHGFKNDASYEYSWYQWLKSEDFETDIFDPDLVWGKIAPNKFIKSIQWRYAKNFIARYVSEYFTKAAVIFKPELVIVVCGRFIKKDAIEEVKVKTGAAFFHFYGEDFFNNLNTTGILRSAALSYDHFFTTKSFNVSEMNEIGINNVTFIPHGYISGSHYPVQVSKNDAIKYGSDLVFVGSWEKPRAQILEQLHDFDMKIWGSQWYKLPPWSKIYRKVQKRDIYCEEMSKAFNASKICLAFLRKANRDMHSSRTFEIPACGGFQLSERTEEVLNYFEEGKEIECFSSVEELKVKTQYYLKHPTKREQVAHAGLKRVQTNPYSYLDRVKMILGYYQSKAVN